MTPLHRAHELIGSADHVLLTAGAGLSGAAGFDYADTDRFAEVFPELTSQGFRNRLEFINPHLPDEILWGFWARHLMDIRFDQAANPLYTELRQMFADRDVFVMTSNVDELFSRNGFDPERIFTPQGDYGLYQCMTPCSRDVWDSRPIVDRLLPLIDPTDGSVPSTAVPRCPNCGGRTFLNVNVGTSYLSAHFMPGLERLNAWLATTVGSRLVVVEFGAGYNTPGVIRMPDERLVASHPNAHLVRVNPTHPQVPAEITDKSTSVAADAAKFLRSRPLTPTEDDDLPPTNQS